MNEFWDTLEKLIAGATVVIDRPRGSRHPRYPDIVYPLDYGFLAGTSAIDGGGVDVWRGSLGGDRITAALVTVDLVKKDVEVKLLLGCTPSEIGLLEAFYNKGPYMKCALIAR